MKGHKMKKASGGAIDGGRGSKEEDREIEDKKSEFKRGGKAKKHGGKVDGKMAKMRADKYKRGGHVKKHKDGGNVKSAGGMTAMSPLSGAGKTAEPMVPKNDKSDD